MLNFHDKYSCKIEEAVKLDKKKGASHLSHLLIEFGTDLESLGHMTWKLLKNVVVL